MHPKILLAAVVVMAAIPALAQEDGGVSTNDGGGQEILESIHVPAIRGAPFSLVLATEWTRPLANGGTFTIANSRPIKRDGTGRIYEERWLLAPKGSKIRSRMSWIQIEDPNAHTLLECNARTKICELEDLNPEPIRPDPALARSGPLKSGRGTHTHEDLGGQYFAGVPVHGYRETTTIAAGQMGNDAPMSTVREFRYSPELKLNLSSTVEAPQVGKQTFTVTEITTTEPDASFFATPVGYQVVDRREKAKVGG